MTVCPPGNRQHLNRIDPQSDFQRRTWKRKQVSRERASSSFFFFFFEKVWSVVVQRRVEGREEALPLWYAQLRWPLWEPYPMSWERFYQLEHDGPGRGLAGIRAGSLTCTVTHRSLSLVRKIVSAGFAMAARPSWDFVQGIYLPRSCRRRVLPIGKFTPLPPATSWKRILPRLSREKQSQYLRNISC